MEEIEVMPKLKRTRAYHVDDKEEDSKDAMKEKKNPAKEEGESSKRTKKPRKLGKRSPWMISLLVRVLNLLIFLWI